ncbi:MAG TPA: hypothetical protein VIW21_12660 [Chthoniobacterales bacterium]
MSVRICVAIGVLLLLINIVCGGEYQRAVDGKTLVWNNDPKPNDAASWSGKQDKEGYATGYGTLVWYTIQRTRLTGSNLPTDKRVPISSYTGNMTRGKLDGAVIAADPSGKFYHGTFVNGRRTSDWAAGVPRVRRAELVEAASPAEGPSQAKTEKPEAPPPAKEAASRAKTQQPSVETSSKTTPIAAGEPTTQVSDSLRSLTAPPASLRTEAATGPAAPALAPPPSTRSSAPAAEASARLNAAEAIELADAEARNRGYNLNEYQHPQSQHVTDSETWSVSYEPNTSSATAFSVIIDEKTMKAQIRK